jgi:transmembrane sensor
MIQARHEPTRVEQEAAAWFSRMLNPPIENEDLARFEAWRRDPANLAAYNRIEDISRLALSLQHDPELKAIAQQAKAARAATAKPRPAAPSFLQRPRTRWTLGLAFAALLAAATYAWQVRAPSYATPIGGQLEAQLADGTRIRLNTNSALKVRFDGRTRRVELLRGQAFFDVAHDASKPFIVTAGAAEVRAVGTRFDVRRDGDGVKVVLTQGKVLVSERGVSTAPTALAPGQSVRAGGKIGVSRPVAADTDAATGWTLGHLTFRSTPLPEAVAEINRYSRDKIVLGEDIPAEARVNGVFAIDKPGEFVAAVTTLYGLKREQRPNGDTELRGP